MLLVTLFPARDRFDPVSPRQARAGRRRADTRPSVLRRQNDVGAITQPDAGYDLLAERRAASQK
jgi:hypothetical protein